MYDVRSKRFLYTCAKIEARIKLQVLKTKKLLNCRGRLLNLETPAVMGIINCTSDSFYVGSRVESESDILLRAEKMLEAGAQILDIGAQSTRPGAEMRPEAEERSVLTNAVLAIHTRFPEAIISADTFRASVAEAALEAGASIINDISAGDDDPEMFPLIIRHNVPYILMHKQGNPATMQVNPHYSDITEEIIRYFIPKINYLKAHGVHDVLIDPGFGFGKTLDHNYTLLQQLDRFAITELPVIVGVSRKRMIQQVLTTDAQHALNGTTVLHTYALLKGASILRVHDVKEAVEAVQLLSRVGFEA